MRYRILLATTAGLATLTAGAGIAAAQSDEDTTPVTTESTTEPTEPTTDSTTVTDPADDGTDTTDGQPEARDRPAGGEGCGDGADAERSAETDASTS